MTGCSWYNYIVNPLSPNLRQILFCFLPSTICSEGMLITSLPKDTGVAKGEIPREQLVAMETRVM